MDHHKTMTTQDEIPPEDLRSLTCQSAEKFNGVYVLHVNNETKAVTGDEAEKDVQLDREYQKPLLHENVMVKANVPDGGYGWFIVLGCFLAHVIIGGFDRNDGIYYLQFKSKFDESAQLTSWPGAIVSTIRLFLGPIAGAVCNRYSVRSAVLVGSIITTLAYVLSAYSPNFYFLFVSHSALQGLGLGLVSAPSLIIVGMYFDKHRGLATGLGSSGVGVGTFCIVPLTQWLFDNYGFQGTFLILGSVAMHGLIVAMLYRPLSLHNTFTRKRIYKREQLMESSELQLSPCTKDVFSSNEQAGISYDQHKMQDPDINGTLKPNTADNHLLDVPDSLRGTKKHSWLLSSLRICFPVEKQEKKCQKGLFHFSLLKDSSFFMFCLSIALFTSAFKAAFTFIPALVKSKGISQTEAALVLSITGVFDTLGRITSGLIFDLKTIRPFRFVIYTSLLFAIAGISFILPSMTNFASLSVLCCLYGSLTGAYIAQKSVVIVDILGVQNMASSFGLLICFQAVGTCVGPPLSGAFRDLFGSFDEAFYLGGSLMIAAGLCMVVSNIFLKTKTRRMSLGG